MNLLSTTKMSSKGQVVIPEEIREQLHLQTGSQFIVVAEEGVVILKVIDTPKLSDFKRIIAAARKAAKDLELTPEDIENAIKEARQK
jgi:AbrB family looped-hinge helix DNA binding protein